MASAAEETEPAGSPAEVEYLKEREFPPPKKKEGKKRRNETAEEKTARREQRRKLREEQGQREALPAETLKDN